MIKIAEGLHGASTPAPLVDRNFTANNGYTVRMVAKTTLDAQAKRNGFAFEPPSAEAVEKHRVMLEGLQAQLNEESERFNSAFGGQ